MRLGISSYAFTWAIGVPGYAVESPMSALQLLEEAVQLNVTCVQIADNMPLHLLSTADASALKRQADASHIAIEIGTRGLQPENIRNYLELAVQFESPILRVVIDTADFQPSILEIIENLQIINPWLEKRQVKLAIENHDRFKAHEFVQMLEGARSEFIGICLDSVNSLGAGEGVEVVTELLGPFTLNLHVKEFVIRRLDHKMGFLVEGRPAGQGMLPLKWMLLKVNPQCTSAILEQWVPPEKTLEETCAKEKKWAQWSIQYLKTLLH